MQNLTSTTTLKERFHIYKSDTNTGKRRCGAAKHLVECCTTGGKFDSHKIQLKASVNDSGKLLEQKIWQRQKYQQERLFTLSHARKLLI